MPDWLVVVLLGLVEGITEFLPVSSTGHLLLLQNTGVLPAQSELFNVGIQSGAVLAVLAVFWRRSVQLLVGFRRPRERDYLVKLLAAFLLTAVGGAALKGLGLELPESATPVALATLIGGVLILFAERRLQQTTSEGELDWKVTIAVAFAQLLAATCPGTSRSGACMVAAMLLGLRRPAATEFSFLVGVPTLLSAGFLEVALTVARGEAKNEHWGLLALGTAVSALVAFVVVHWLLRFVQTHTLNAFGWYRIALGALILGVVATRSDVASVPDADGFWVDRTGGAAAAGAPEVHGLVPVPARRHDRGS